MTGLDIILYVIYFILAVGGIALFYYLVYLASDKGLRRRYKEENDIGRNGTDYPIGKQTQGRTQDSSELRRDITIGEQSILPPTTDRIDSGVDGNGKQGRHNDEDEGVKPLGFFKHP